MPVSLTPTENCQQNNPLNAAECSSDEVRLHLPAPALCVDRLSNVFDSKIYGSISAT